MSKKKFTFIKQGINILLVIVFTLFGNCKKKFEYGFYKDDGACFSPDGGYIAFAHTQVYNQSSDRADSLVSGIYIMKLDGSELKLVCEGLGNTVDWSHDGKMLVFNKGNKLWIYQIEKDSLIQLTGDSEIKHSALFSPDNNKIAYFRVFVPGGIYIINIDGSEDHRAIGYSMSGPEWFNSGDKFLFVGWFKDSIYPDGTTILCSSDTLGRYLIKILSADVMDFHADQYRYPRLSPNENEILFFALKKGENQNYEIWKVNIEGTNPKQLTNKGGTDPCWSPDGKWILFSDGSTGGLTLMKPDGSDHRFITRYD
jgi:Tol biopolymer transport system component